MTSPFAVRGVIEGFYGNPWTHAQRLDWIRFIGARGMNTFVYGPKDDPLVRRRWAEPYDDDALARLAELAAAGAEAGVALVYAISPGLSIRYSSDADRALLLARSRRLWKRLSRRGCLSLRWAEPGTVWATDFTEPPAAIEGQYTKILLVRDLASGMTLLSQPCEGEDGLTVAAALKSLFLQYGPPLVLKHDNGSPFCCEEVSALLARERVIGLPSPPRYPQYNGACEAGGGSIKTRAHHLSARAGRPVWPRRMN